MARIYLEANDRTFTVTNGVTEIWGMTGENAVTVNADAVGCKYDANIERIIFSGASSDYTYLQSGNTVKVYKNGVEVANVGVQTETGDTNGTQFTFTNGTVDTIFVPAVTANGVITTAASMKLGGATIPTTTAATV